MTQSPLPSSPASNSPNKEVSAEELVQQALEQSNIDAKTMISPALNWASQYDILSDWHINNIVITLMSICSFLYNVELDIDVNNKAMAVTATMGLWSLLSTKRINKLEDEVSKTLSVYSPGYIWILKFKYGKINKRSK